MGVFNETYFQHPPIKGREILDTCIGSSTAGQFTKNINHGGYMKLVQIGFPLVPSPLRGEGCVRVFDE